MMRIARLIWAVTFTVGTVIATICILPMILTLAIFKVITSRDKDE
jgi:hypothetical protein